MEKKAIEQFVKSNDWMHPMIPHGWGNEYVVLPPEHPYNGVGYDFIECEVHGGLTFAESASNISTEFGLPDDISTDSWIIGFDTANSGDGPHLTEQWVTEETARLAKQMEDAWKDESIDHDKLVERTKIQEEEIAQFREDIKSKEIYKKLDIEQKALEDSQDNK